MILIYLLVLFFLMKLECSCQYFSRSFIVDLFHSRLILRQSQLIRHAEVSDTQERYLSQDPFCSSQAIIILIINPCYMKRSPLARADNLPKASPPRKLKQSLLIEIKIKNKPLSHLLIEDVQDAQATQRQIKSYMTTHKLKNEAFDYINSIVHKKIDAKQTLKTSKNTCKLTKQQVECKKILFSKRQKENRHVLLSRNEIRQAPDQNNPSSMLVTADSQSKPQIQNSLVFNASFSLPSSIADKDKSFVTDRLFENEFNTGTFSSDFSTVNEMNMNQQIETKFIHPSLSIRIQQSPAISSPSQGQTLRIKKRKKSPIKIILGKKTVQASGTKISIDNNEEREVLGKMKPQIREISPKDRKNVMVMPNSHSKRQLEEQFQIYSDNKGNYFKNQFQVQGSLLGDQCLELQCSLKPSEQSLLTLFRKLTKQNPPNIREIHSQYVSYQELTREQLFLMGTLFERIDPEALNHLDYHSFKCNAFKYCLQQLEALNDTALYP